MSTSTTTAEESAGLSATTLLRSATAGSADDGKSTLMGRLRLTMVVVAGSDPGVGRNVATGRVIIAGSLRAPCTWTEGSPICTGRSVRMLRRTGRVVGARDSTGHERATDLMVDAASRASGHHSLIPAPMRAGLVKPAVGP